MVNGPGIARSTRVAAMAMERLEPGAIVMSEAHPDWVGTVIGALGDRILVRWRDRRGRPTQRGWAVEDRASLYPRPRAA
jgi:hypothetical protein